MPAIPKPRPQIFAKRDARREIDRQQRDVYTLVAQRDRSMCRCCGRKGTYGIGGEKTLHRHHLVYRSNVGATSSRNCLTLCAMCHSLVHARQLWPVGTDADRHVKFEIHAAVVVDLFGTRLLPAHVRRVK